MSSRRPPPPPPKRGSVRGVAPLPPSSRRSVAPKPPQAPSASPPRHPSSRAQPAAFTPSARTAPPMPNVSRSTPVPSRSSTRALPVRRGVTPTASSIAPTRPIGGSSIKSSAGIGKPRPPAPRVPPSPIVPPAGVVRRRRRRRAIPNSGPPSVSKPITQVPTEILNHDDMITVDLPLRKTPFTFHTVVPAPQSYVERSYVYVSDNISHVRPKVPGCEIREPVEATRTSFITQAPIRVSSERNSTFISPGTTKPQVAPRVRPTRAPPRIPPRIAVPKPPLPSSRMSPIAQSSSDTHRDLVSKRPEPPAIQPTVHVGSDIQQSLHPVSTPPTSSPPMRKVRQPPPLPRRHPPAPVSRGTSSPIKDNIEPSFASVRPRVPPPRRPVSHSSRRPSPVLARTSGIPSPPTAIAPPPKALRSKANELASSPARSNLLSQIQAGAKLKKTVVPDSSRTTTTTPPRSGSRSKVSGMPSMAAARAALRPTGRFGLKPVEKKSASPPRETVNRFGLRPVKRP